MSKVTKEMAELVYPVASKFIESACEYSCGEITEANIYEQIVAGECSLILIYKDDCVVAAVTAEVRTCPSGKRLLALSTVGGDYMDEWLEELKDNAKQWAIDSDCEDIYIIGRPGWERMLKQFNFSKAHIVMSCSVEDMK